MAMTWAPANQRGPSPRQSPSKNPTLDATTPKRHHGPTAEMSPVVLSLDIWIDGIERAMSAIPRAVSATGPQRARRR